jgi:hypothetical protein
MAYAWGIMNKPYSKQPRAASRFRLHKPVRLYGCSLPLVAGPSGTSRVVDGRVQNISSGGLCLLAQKRLKLSELLVGEIAVPGTRASIPTLLQVRWLRKNSFGPGYHAGLRFVLQGSITQALQTSARIADFTATGQVSGAYDSKEISPEGECQSGNGGARRASY